MLVCVYAAIKGREYENACEYVCMCVCEGEGVYENMCEWVCMCVGYMK